MARIFFLLLTLLFMPQLMANEAKLSCGAEWSRFMIDHLLNRDLEGAVQVLEEWEKDYPGHESLPLHKALVEVARADYSKDRDTGKYDKPLKLLEAVIDQTRQQLKDEPKAYVARLNLATAEAVSGRLLMEKKRWLKAYQYGHESREIMQGLLQEDPNRHDTLLILGLFEYFTGTLPNVLRWLSYLVDMSGDADLGIAYLEKAVVEAPVAAPQAAESLLVELSHTPEQACHYLALAKTMKGLYPDNPRYSWAATRLKRLCSKLPKKSRPLAKNFTLAEKSCS